MFENYRLVKIVILNRVVVVSKNPVVDESLPRAIVPEYIVNLLRCIRVKKYALSNRYVRVDARSDLIWLTRTLDLE